MALILSITTPAGLDAFREDLSGLQDNYRDGNESGTPEALAADRIMGLLEDTSVPCAIEIEDAVMIEQVEILIANADGFDGAVTMAGPEATPGPR